MFLFIFFEPYCSRRTKDKEVVFGIKRPSPSKIKLTDYWWTNSSQSFRRNVRLLNKKNTIRAFSEIFTVKASVKKENLKNYFEWPSIVSKHLIRLFIEKKEPKIDNLKFFDFIVSFGENKTICSRYFFRLINFGGQSLFDQTEQSTDTIKSCGRKHRNHFRVCYSVFQLKK